ncbi:hypothetical protein NLU13_8984 [Sarocladium strictum]|uniref:Uncharacterized protein n=1 Tax=Sarocladium strictum TaxID=5046 RepID=A0AA39G9W2_SARSR|nr:hypothetical protein NLU13_8984 [Sarocladium strictum]
MGRMPNRSGSGPWSRLRPVEQDPLDAIGLPSKGDTKLLDKKAQEKYYTKIVERYMSFCSDAGKRDELLRRFANLKMEDLASSSAPPVKGAPFTQLSPEALQDQASNKSLSSVMMALRKLREGIVGSKRADAFSVQAYLFNIRLSVLVKQPESYHPAMLHLLNNMHMMHPLTATELQEVVTYLILDTACRRGDLAEAFMLRQRYHIRDIKLDSVLSALVHDNWFKFRQARRRVDGHQARLMDFATDDMRLHTLKCFGRTYMSVDLPYLESMTERKWDELQEKDKVGWDLDGEKVVIRRVKAKPQVAEP